VPCAPAHPGRPRVPSRAALFKAATEPGREPQTLAAPGEPPLTAHTIRRRRRWRRRRRGERSRPRESRTPRRPEPPVGGAGPAVNAYFHYFLFLLDVALPPSSSSSPASRTASLHRRAQLRPVATEVRIPVSPYLWTPRPSSRGGTPAAPRRRAAAGDAGHRARLGRVFLQVPPPSPMRVRRLPSLAPLAVGSRPVLVAFARASVRAAMPSRRRAPPHARPVTLEARPGLWPFSCAGPPARPPRCLRRHGLAVAGCLAHANAEEGAPPS
jgi:hypothetical protein